MAEAGSNDDHRADAASPLDRAAERSRLPRWFVFAILSGALGTLVVALVALSVGVVLLSRGSSPHTVVLRSGSNQTPAALLESPPGQDETAPSAGPLGILEPGAPAIGKPAPDFALLDLQGRRVELSALRGKAVVVNFWATWCGPCRQEFPELQKASATLGNSVVVLALDQAESPAKVSQFRDEFGATFTILLDSHANVANGYRLSGIPDTIFVDASGIVRDIAFGPLSAGTFRYKMNHLLAQPQSQPQQ